MLGFSNESLGGSGSLRRAPSRHFGGRIEQFNLATAEEIQIDTLAKRLEAEVVALCVRLIGPIQFGAWIRKA